MSIGSLGGVCRLDNDGRLFPALGLDRLGGPGLDDIDPLSGDTILPPIDEVPPGGSLPPIDPVPPVVPPIQPTPPLPVIPEPLPPMVPF